MQQQELFRFDASVSLEDVFEAYYECRRHKRGTLNALAFELNYEENLIRLWREINKHAYKPGRSIAFVVKRPVKREVFAADFRDRVVHHLIIKKLNPFFEKIFSPASCSCREGKGTLYAVKGAQYFLKKFKEECGGCYVLKMDIQAFFMSIDCRLLFQRLALFIRRYYAAPDRDLILELVKKTVLSRPQDCCVRKGSPGNWKDLPPFKSLFHAPLGQGMPIGNLTSQVFANFYLNLLDRFMRRFPVGYVRYVDDFTLFHPDKRLLMDIRRKTRVFLKKRLHLTLHPKKVFLQHYSKGFDFIGTRFKGTGLYPGRRLKRSFLNKMYYYGSLPAPLKKETVCKIGTVVNSYFGFLKHTRSYGLRLKGFLKLGLNGRLFILSGPFGKCRPLWR